MGRPSKEEIDNLKATLIAELNYSEAELEGKSKKELEAMVAKAKSAEVAIISTEKPAENSEYLFPDMDKDRVAVTTLPTEVKSTATPSLGDPGWSDYVLSLISEKEKIKDSPRMDALRRVAIFLYGRFATEIQVHNSPTKENGGRATVSAKLTFTDTNIVATGAADVSELNTHSQYAVHAVATAETRAKGRALKEALCLQNVHTAEEKQFDEEDQSKKEQIDIGFCNTLQQLADRMKVNIVRLAMSKGFNIGDPIELTKGQAQEIVQDLNAFINKKKEIPDGIKQ
jgi:hypothetical protein